MTSISLVFIVIYIFAILMGTVVTTLALIFAMKNKTSLNRTLSLFSVAFLIYVVFELFVFYALDSKASTKILLNCVHITNICYFIFTFCWIKILMILSENQRIIKEKIWIVVTLTYGIIAEGIAIFIAEYDPITQYFKVTEGSSKQILDALNILYGLLVLYLAGRYVCYAWQTVEKKRATLASGLFGSVLFIYTLWIIYWDYSFASGMVIDASENYTMDPLVFAYMAQSILVIVFFFKKDPLEVTKQASYVGEPVSTPPRIAEKTIREVAPIFCLTEREIQVLELVYQGCSNPEIGEKLFIAENTVKRHVNNIFRKTETKNRYELLSFVTVHMKERETQ